MNTGIFAACFALERVNTVDFIVLNEFLAVAETAENGFGSFKAAAEGLNVLPSTLSKHIKLLEDELGAPLFDRTTRRVFLNDFGRVFLPHAKEMYASYMECRSAIDQYILPHPPVLRYGTVVPLAPGNKYLNAMRICEKKYPGYGFQLSEFSNWTIKKLLRAGSLEFIIAYEEENDSQEFDVHPIETDQLVAIAAEDHPLCAQEQISLDMLRDENIITSPRSSFVGDFIHSVCRAADYSPRVWYSDNSTSNLTNVVDHGGGIGLIMESSARYLIGPHTKILPLTLTASLQLCSLSLRECRLSPIATTFLTELWQVDSTSPAEESEP